MIVPVARPIICTLWMPDRVFQAMDVLRRRHFPPERNLVPAHVTLFHHLPGTEAPRVADEARSALAEVDDLEIVIEGARSLGRGAALVVRSEALAIVRESLAARLEPWLIAQDRAGWRPHLTVANRIEPAQARRLVDELASSVAPLRFQALGLILHRYDEGPWTELARLRHGSRLVSAGRRP